VENSADSHWIDLIKCAFKFLKPTSINKECKEEHPGPVPTILILFISSSVSLMYLINSAYLLEQMTEKLPTFDISFPSGPAAGSEACI
jgi:hypothetical protein